MATIERSIRSFSDGTVTEATLRKRGVKHPLLNVQHVSDRGIIASSNAHWLTVGVDMRDIVAEQVEILRRFPAGEVAISVSHETGKRDKKNSSPRDYLVVDNEPFSYRNIRALYGGRRPYWLRFFCEGSIDLFWGSGIDGQPQEISIGMPAGNEAMVEHVGDLLTRTRAFSIITEQVFLEMLDETRTLLQTNLAEA
ncbi:MAG: hypothetical protein Q7T41_01180 [Candidatus Saccharibacteria bacterium]|nr:hypothetical protein [Candidatus Saccharibacteria bacterium]